MKVAEICCMLLLVAPPTMADSTNYVSLGGTHVFPFTSPLTAATNIQAAVDAAENGDTVIVAEGHYLLNDTVAVSTEIVITAVSNEVVTIDGQGERRCFIIDDIPCVLRGLTIANGYISGAEAGAGIYSPGNSAIVSNCTISGCVSADGDGGGVAGTSVYNTHILNNYAGLNGGGASSAEVYSCRVENNTGGLFGGGVDGSLLQDSLVLSNLNLASLGYGLGGAAHNSSIVNCTVVNNHSNGDAGGAAGGLILNAIFVNNTADGSGMNFSGSVTISNSCSPDLIHGVDGNITNAPVFVDSSADDYHLLLGSPCINKGNNLFVSSSYDYGGNPRIVSGVVDIGAYEFQTSSLDTDGDGLPDEWEALYFKNLNALPGDNEDADIFNNLAEYIAGTDPTNSMSYFAVSNSMDSSFVVQWNTVPDREYSVFWAPSLTNSFQLLEAGLDYPRSAYTNLLSNPCGFYRIKVNLK